MNCPRRVRNDHLQHKFELEKQSSFEDLANPPNVTRLFHGTCQLNPKEICLSMDGFDPRFSRPGLLGRQCLCTRARVAPRFC